MISAGPLRRLMVERDLSLGTLAMACGVPKYTIENIISDKGLTYDNLNMLCRVLEVQPKDIIKYYEEEL